MVVEATTERHAHKPVSRWSAREEAGWSENDTCREAARISQENIPVACDFKYVSCVCAFRVDSYRLDNAKRKRMTATV